MKNDKKLQIELLKIYEERCEKLQSSVADHCNNNSTGIPQMIGRNYGAFWEDLLKKIFEFTTQIINNTGECVTIKKLVLEIMKSNMKAIPTSLNLEELSLSIKEQICKIMSDKPISLSDLSYKNGDNKKTIDFKWRLRWNDAKIINTFSMGASILKTDGYDPILLIKTTRDQNREKNLDRFEENGWKVLTGTESMDFILNETGFNLQKWITNHVDFWPKLSSYHKLLEDLNFKKEDFNFCA